MCLGGSRTLNKVSYSRRMSRWYCYQRKTEVAIKPNGGVKLDSGNSTKLRKWLELCYMKTGGLYIIVLPHAQIPHGGGEQGYLQP